MGDQPWMFKCRLCAEEKAPHKRLVHWRKPYGFNTGTFSEPLCQVHYLEALMRLQMYP